MDVKNLVTLKTIVEEGSFLKAAQKLNYTQSTITFQVQQLENELNIKLFEKIGRNMKITENGREILKYTDDILQNMEKIKRVGHQDDEITGELKIAVRETLLSYKMQEVLVNFKHKAPNVKISLQSSNCFQIRNGILNGDVDIGIFYDVGILHESLHITKLRTYPIVLVGSTELDESCCDFATPNQRIHTNFITNERHSVFRDVFENYLREQNIILDDTIELWSVEAIKKSVISNLGVSHLPIFTVQEELDAGLLKTLPHNIAVKEITAICGYHKNKWLSPAMQLFIDEVLAAM